jgi:hypothetical protein
VRGGAPHQSGDIRLDDLVDRRSSSADEAAAKYAPYHAVMTISAAEAASKRATNYNFWQLAFLPVSDKRVSWDGFVCCPMN